MLVFRSSLFNTLYYLMLILFMLVMSPLFLTPRKTAMFAMRSWAWSADWLHRLVVGATVEIRGRENLIHGPCIIASKHQSLWETYGLLRLLDDPAIIYKQELGWIPFFGWYAVKFRMVKVQRGGRSKAIRSLIASARDRLAENRQIIIFPEGTRRPPGAEPVYRAGVTAMYNELGVPVVPVALNSGLFWPRRKFMRYPGKIIVDILPPIAPGMEREDFTRELVSRLERASDQLLLETAGAANPPPLPETARKRLEELGQS